VRDRIVNDLVTAVAAVAAAVVVVVVIVFADVMFVHSDW
jgi:hypothetical protein